MPFPTTDISYHLIKDPTKLSTSELEEIASEEFHCMVPLKDYLNLKLVADKMSASSKALDILLCASLEKSQRIQDSFLELEDRFEKLMKLRDDTLFVSVRGLEDGLSRTSRLLDNIREEFEDGGMTEDSFSESLTLIASTLEECEPDLCISRIFDEVTSSGSEDTKSCL